MPTTKFAAVLVAQLVLGAPAVAQVVPPPSGVPGAFEVLPPGDRIVADSLFLAQAGPTRWTRDQIATARLSGDGWGGIFHEMRGDGLIQAKSLDQVLGLHLGAIAKGD